MSTTHNISRDCAVVILAAGLSGRMGAMKPFLVWNGKTTFLEKIIHEYKSFGCREINVVLNQTAINHYLKEYLTFLRDCRVILNHHPEQERFVSVRLGLGNLVNDLPVFVQNVDNPFVNQDVLKQLYENLPRTGYVCPFFEGKGGHPILLTEEAMRQISEITGENHNFRDVLLRFVKHPVQVADHHILVNVNTREDYENLFGQNPRA